MTNTVKILIPVTCAKCGVSAMIDKTAPSGWTQSIIIKRYYCPKCSK